MNAGYFKAEILPVALPSRKGPAKVVEQDESPRPDASIEAMGALKPVFQANGTVTAANAPGMNDGAAALVVTSADYAARHGRQPIARVLAQAASGIEPMMVMMAPVAAVEKLLKKAGWTKDQVDLFELNEAFSVQAVALIQEMGLDPAKVNVNGGAVALGHPIGASGARILTTLLHEMQRRNVRRGVAALCLGGGNAFALAVER
jgi:acetyl-CoA C-acetyltransferase